jgi:Flp pilus assembly pilin Flp
VSTPDRTGGHFRCRSSQQAEFEIAQVLAARADSVNMTNVNLILNRLYADMRNRAAREDGQALIEYALIISLIALVALVALQQTGTNIKGVLNTIAGEV